MALLWRLSDWTDLPPQMKVLSIFHPTRFTTHAHMEPSFFLPLSVPRDQIYLFHSPTQQQPIVPIRLPQQPNSHISIELPFFCRPYLDFDMMLADLATFISITYHLPFLVLIRAVRAGRWRLL